MRDVARGKKNVNGEGSKVRQRKDGCYETRAVLDTPTGRRRVSFYGATAREANEKKIAALADQNRGVMFLDPKGLTVAEYLTRWLSDAVRYQVSEGTYLGYERTWRNHFLPFFKRLRFRDLTPAHVRAFKARKIEEGLNPNYVGNLQGRFPRRSTRRSTTGSSHRIRLLGSRKRRGGVGGRCLLSRERRPHA